MLKKKNRVGRRDIAKIFKIGRFINSENLTLKFILAKENTLPRVSFIVSKKVAKGAVERNLLRRHGYVALEKFYKTLPQELEGVFIFNKNQKIIKNLREEIKNILNKIK